jgi:hypothetical protein
MSPPEANAMIEVALPVLAVLGIVVILLIGRIVGRAQRAYFNARFPPISDAEFVARCTPGTSPDVALRVRRIVARNLAVDYDRVHPSMSFIEDIGAD